MIYPIIDLKRSRARVPARDVHAYLRALETATVDGLKNLRVTGAEARVTEVGQLSLTGVWTGDHKIASIGIAVRKWVTYHGVAINLTEDARAFSGIKPCGFTQDVMTSVERVLGRVVPGPECRAAFAQSFTAAFSAV